MDFAGHVAFLASDRGLHGYTTDRMEMIGRGGDLSDPAALRRWGLSGRVAAGLDACAALQAHVDLGPHESTELCFFLGQAEDRRGARSGPAHARPGAVDPPGGRAGFWERLLGAVACAPDPPTGWPIDGSPDPGLALPRPDRLHRRAAPSVRDQLQDCLALVHADPALTRQHLPAGTARQFAARCSPLVAPPGAGVRTRSRTISLAGLRHRRLCRGDRRCHRPGEPSFLAGRRSGR
jgi:cyclic beta-1,2-glucan synthetase